MSERPTHARSARSVDPELGVHEGHERIGPTAHYTAYVWHRLRLPHAEHFKTGTGRLLYWGFFALGEWTTRLSSRVPTMRDYLEYRHRLIEAVACAEQPDLLVELASGLSRRAITFAADHGVPSIEFDLPAMAAEKQRRVDALPLPLRERLAGRHRVCAADVLAPDFAEQLADAVRGAHRPVVIAEGLLSYFDPEARRQFLDAVALGLRRAGGGLFICDTHTRQAQARVGLATRVLKTAIVAVTRRRRALSAFADRDELLDGFARAGFDAVAVVRPEDLAPALTHLRSPALIVTGRVTAG